MDVRVCLLSGRTAVVTVREHELVESLLQQAQSALGGKGRLMDSSGAALDPSSTVKRARLQPADSVTLQLRPPRVHGYGSTVIIEGDGTVMRDVSSPLRRVSVVQATSQAWAAILEDGSVVTWGNPSFWGDSGWAEPELHDVVEIQATDFAFAALMRDGSVSAWGDADSGGGTPLMYSLDPAEPEHFLDAVTCIQATRGAFAAIRRDGSVIAWGDHDVGGPWAFAAIRAGQCSGFRCHPQRRIRRSLGRRGRRRFPPPRLQGDCGHPLCIRRHPQQWLRRELGRPPGWGGRLHDRRPLGQGDSVELSGLRSHLGEWLRGHLGRSRIRRGVQHGSPAGRDRPTGDDQRFRCDSAGWLRGHLGVCHGRRRQQQGAGAAARSRINSC